MRTRSRASAAEAPSFGSLILRGTSWKLFSQVAVQVGRIGFVLVLARLLTPRDFGLVAMALVITGFVIAFADLGLGAALIQRETIDEHDRSTVFWTGIGAGVVLTLAGVAVSWPLASFYREPAVRGMMAALSLSFLVSSLGATQRALMTREMNFRTLELSNIAGVWVGGAVGVFGASIGWGAWSLVVQQLTNAASSAAIVWLTSTWRPRLTFSFASLRSLGGYGGNVLGVRLAYYVQESSLPLIIGRSLGSGALGLFTIAYTIVLAPLTRFAIPVGEVLFPAFARLQNEPERMSALWLRLLRVLAALCIPAMTGLVVVAPDIVPVVLGTKWKDAVPVVQILALVGLLQALAAWNGTILMGLGRANVLFRATITFLFVYVLAFLVGVHWGIKGVAVAYAIASATLEAVYLLLTTRALGLSFFAPARTVAGVIQAAVMMVLVTFGLRAALVQQHVPAGARVVLVVAAGIVSYFAFCRWRAPEVFAEVKSVRRRRRDEAAAPAGVPG